MKTAEQVDNVISVRAGRQSNRVSVNHKMQAIADESGDISYDTVMRVVAEEIDAEKKSKLYLRLALLLLFCLLALTAANAGLTFAIVEYAKDTKMDGSVMTNGSDVVQVANTDMTVKGSALVGSDNASIATAQAPKEYLIHDLFNACVMQKNYSKLNDITSLSLTDEAGVPKTYRPAGFEIADDLSSITFETQSGAKIEVTTQGEITLITENAERKLQKRQNWIAAQAYVRDAVGPKEAAAPSILSNIWKTPEIRFDTGAQEKLLFTAMMGAAKSAAFKEAAAVSNLQISRKEFDSTKVTGYDSVTGMFTLKPGLSEKKESILWGGDTPTGVSSSCGATTSGETDLTVAGFCSSRPCQRCQDVDMHAYVSITAMGGSQANDILNDIWGYSNGGRDYVIIGSNDKAYVIELTDPNNPSHTGYVALSGSAFSWGVCRNVWTDVKVDGNTVYIVSWKQGSSIQTVDGTTFNSMPAPSAATAITSTPYTLTGYTGSHNIQVYNGDLYLFWNSPADGFYACGAGDTGTIIVRTSNMSLRSCISDSIVEVGHDMACHAYGSNHRCFIAKGGTNNGNWSTQFSGYGTVAVNVGNANSVSVAYTVPNYSNMHFTHQPALTSNGGHMITTDELDESDIGMSGQIMMRLFLYTTNAYSASLVQTYDTGNNVSDHQGYFSDNYYFLAAYKRGFLGFALNTSSNSMSYKGWMDTWAYSNGRGLVGAWSLFVFPYSACGGNTYYTVVVSDNSGLYIMQPRWKTGSRSCNSKPTEYKGDVALRQVGGIRVNPPGEICRDCLAGEAIKSDPVRREDLVVQQEAEFYEVGGKFMKKEPKGKGKGLKF